MKILLIGADGQLGHDFIKINKDHILTPLTIKDIDITNVASLKIIYSEKPDIVISTAAFHEVDLCEDESEKAFNVNAIGHRNLAKITNEIGIPLVFFSTDYVFDGEQESPYIETDKPNPQSEYAKSKLAGEKFIEETNQKHYIIRTTGLYGIKGAFGKRSGNFVDAMITLSSQQNELNVVNDQRMTPTYTHELATQVYKLIKTENYGLYHITNNSSCTWLEFAKKIFEIKGINVKLTGVSSAEYGAKAKRPKYSVLQNKKLEDMRIELMSNWEDALRQYLKEKY